MGKIVKFAPRTQTLSAQEQERARRDQHARQTLAKWLREMADLIEGDMLENDPLAGVLILSGREANQVLHLGYKFDDVSFEAACRAAGRKWMCRDTDINIFPV